MCGIMVFGAYKIIAIYGLEHRQVINDGSKQLCRRNSASFHRCQQHNHTKYGEHTLDILNVLATWQHQPLEKTMQYRDQCQKFATTGAEAALLSVVGVSTVSK